MAAPELDAPIGSLRGTRPRPGVTAFLGIPYAVPPVGHRRFLPPEPHGGWPAVRDASACGPHAPQTPSFLDSLGRREPAPQSEDCLTLNVWTPDPGACLPVLVWIHGGAFLSGSGSLPAYDGAALASRGDTVVVTLNYRLGALGFLHLDDAEGSGVAGLLDQIEALRWVRRNIGAFGGDAARVTVFGESAGAMSIGSLLGMEAADGLFRQAVLQSGAARHLVAPGPAAAGRRRFLQQLGLPEGSGAAELRSLPAEAMLAAQAAVLAHSGDALPFVPVVDGFRLQHPLERLRAGRVCVDRIVVGTTLDENRLFTTFDPVVQQLDRTGVLARAAQLGVEDPDGLVEHIHRRRPGLTWPEVWSAVATDDVFRQPADQLLDAAAAAGIECRSYLFTWPVPGLGGRMGACHAVDVPFVFDNLDQPGLPMLIGTGDEQIRLARRLSEAWRGFAAGDDPWPRLEPTRRTIVFDGSAEDTVLDDPHAGERAAWGDRWHRPLDAGGRPWPFPGAARVDPGVAAR